jgi:hypothetical protein
MPMVLDALAPLVKALAGWLAVGLAHFLTSLPVASLQSGADGGKLVPRKSPFARAPRYLTKSLGRRMRDLLQVYGIVCDPATTFRERRAQ